MGAVFEFLVEKDAVLAVEMADVLLFVVFCERGGEVFLALREAVLARFDRGLGRCGGEIAGVCCRYHDFRRFARHSCVGLGDFNFDSFRRVQIFGQGSGF